MILSLNFVRFIKAKFIPKFADITKTAFSSKYLLYTNIGISVSLSGMGDVLEQHYEILSDELDSWDPNRTRRMAITGMTVGIICHHWYKFLDKRLPGKSIQIVFKKVLVDQLICSPVYITVFFMTSSLLEGVTFPQFVQEYKQKAWKLYLAEWIGWPPAQVINFYFLPTRFRVLYDNTISLGYDIYTSKVKHSETTENSEERS